MIRWRQTRAMYHVFAPLASTFAYLHVGGGLLDGAVGHEDGLGGLGVGIDLEGHGAHSAGGESNSGASHCVNLGYAKCKRARQL